MGLERLATPPAYPSEFAARVFKIARDPKGARLTYLKVTGGCLRGARAPCLTACPAGAVGGKIKELRFYSGAKFETGTRRPLPVASAPYWASPKPTRARAWGRSRRPSTPSGAGDGLPASSSQGCDPAQLLPKLRQLEEEDPQLHIVWDSRLGRSGPSSWGRSKLKSSGAWSWSGSIQPLRWRKAASCTKRDHSRPLWRVGHF